MEWGDGRATNCRKTLSAPAFSKTLIAVAKWPTRLLPTDHNGGWRNRRISSSLILRPCSGLSAQPSPIDLLPYVCVSSEHCPSGPSEDEKNRTHATGLTKHLEKHLLYAHSSQTVYPLGRPEVSIRFPRPVSYETANDLQHPQRPPFRQTLRPWLIVIGRLAINHYQIPVLFTYRESNAQFTPRIIYLVVFAPRSS